MKTVRKAASLVTGLAYTRYTYTWTHYADAQECPYFGTHSHPSLSAFKDLQAQVEVSRPYVRIVLQF